MEAPPADQLIKKLKPNKTLYKESQIYPSTSQYFSQMAQHLEIQGRVARELCCIRME